MTEHPPTPITTDSAEAALDAGLAAAFATEATGDYHSRAAGFIPAEVAGTIIAGKYRLLERIGEGGMGSVWMAQQTEPVKRYVAVKLIKPGMDSKQVLARFEAERQAFAVMDHPNIAKILDGGITPPAPPSQEGESDFSPPWEGGAGGVASGRPYFVMELVKGVPITKYCDDHKLTPQQRLELFVPVCQAIQHAHQKGIIHRDIKPSNVMVALYDDKPIPKVIDFGVAKATGQALTDQTLNTGFGGIAGTPQYMSPEQASLNNLDIDTRSDIYSLGVLLYELLTGSPPFAQKDLEKAGMLEMLRVIREEEPPRPSTKLSTADALPSLSANRGTEPKKLTGILRNELDWIVMKALEKDRARRYETANGFAADINRYLTGEPVNAHPPSAGYRMKKFLRKNKGSVIASAAVAAALLVGIVGFAWQARVAQSERDIANDERNRALSAEAETKKRAAELKLVSDFQAQMLGQVDPTTAGVRLREDVRAKFEGAMSKAGVREEERIDQSAAFMRQMSRVNATDAARELIDRTILRPAVVAIDKQFKDQPVVDAALRQVLADRYREMGLYESAQPLQEQALATRRRVLGAEHPQTLQSLNNMSCLLEAQGKLNEAEPYCREAAEKCRRVLGEEHPDTLVSISNIGAQLIAQGKLSEAEPLLRDLLRKRRQVLGEEHQATLNSVNGLSLLLWSQQRYTDAEPLWREALDKRRRLLGEEHPDTLMSINNMAGLLHAQNKLSESEPYLREALDKHRRVRGEEHPDTIRCIRNMGALLRSQGKLVAAETYTREALEKYRRVFGEENPDLLTLINSLAVLLQEQGKLSEAQKYLYEALETCRRLHGEEHLDTLNLTNNFGYVLYLQGKLGDAEPYLREALGKKRRVLGDDHPDTVKTIITLCALLTAQRNLSEAELLSRELADTSKRKTGADSPAYAGQLATLGFNLLDQKRWTDAEPILRECLTIREKKEPDIWTTFTTKSLLGGSLLGQKKFADAERQLLAGYEGMMQRSDKILPPQFKQIRLTEAMVRLEALYTAWHAAEPTQGYDAKAAEWKAKLEVMKPAEKK